MAEQKETESTNLISSMAEQKETETTEPTSPTSSMNKQKKTESTNPALSTSEQKTSESTNPTSSMAEQKETESANLTSSMAEQKETETTECTNFTSSTIEQKQTESTPEKDEIGVSFLFSEIYLNQLTNRVLKATCNNTFVLDEYIKQKLNLTEKEKIDLLHQIGYCLMRLQNEKFDFNELSHSQILVEKNFFFKNEKQADKLTLANLYCHLLTNGKTQAYSSKLKAEDFECSNRHEALHIVNEMVDKNVTIEEILQHPFHWSDQQKALFITRAFNYVNAKKKNVLRNKDVDEKKKLLAEYKMGDGNNVIFQNDAGWIIKLKLKKEELKKIQKKKGVVRNTIFDLVRGPNKEEDTILIFELLRFFRNRYAHFDEDTKNIKECFGSFPTGYMKFFSSRFPELFMHVYNSMKTYLSNESNFSEFANPRLNQPFVNVNMYLCPAKAST